MLLEIFPNLLLAIFASIFIIFGGIYFVLYMQYRQKMQNQLNDDLNLVSRYHSGYDADISFDRIYAQLIGGKASEIHTTEVSLVNLNKDKLLSALKLMFDEVQKVRFNEVDHIDQVYQKDLGSGVYIENEINHLYKITHNNESVLLNIHLSAYDRTKKEDTNNGLVRIIHDKNTKFKMDKIIELVNNSRIPVNRLIKNSYSIRNIVKADNGYSTMATSVDTVIKSLDELDISYPNIVLSYADKQHNTKPSKIISPILNAIAAHHNLYITGPVGAGKTVFANFLASTISAESNSRIFYVNSGTLKLFNTPEFYGYVQTIFNTSNVNTEDGKSTKRLNVLIIDEAQTVFNSNKDNTMLLNILDGEFKRAHNLVCICIFSELGSNLDPALFRAGRKGVIIDIKPIQKVDTPAKVKNIKENLAKNEQFDDSLFKELLDKENILTNSDKPYAKAGEITLADAYGCVMPADLSNLFEEVDPKAKLKIPTAKLKKHKNN